MRSHHLGYVKPTPGSDPNLWDSIDKQDTSGWTAEVLQGLIDQAHNFDELDHLLFSLQYARDVTYNQEGPEARNNRMRVTDLMNNVLATRIQWIKNQNAVAQAAQNQLGLIAAPALVPAENYTGKSGDLTTYAQKLGDTYGAVTAVDLQNGGVQYRVAEKAAAEAAAARVAAANAAAAAATAVDHANANPSPQNAMQATAAQLAHQTAEHEAQAAQVAASSVSGEPPSSNVLKYLGLALTLYSFVK